MDEKVFVLDGVAYDTESLPEQAKKLFAVIVQVQEKQNIENMIHNAAIQALTLELSSLKDQFTVVEMSEPENTQEG